MVCYNYLCVRKIIFNFGGLEMATLREELKNKGFDFENGRIIYQPIKENEGNPVCSPGWASESEVEEAIEIDLNHPILDFDFDNDYGDFGMPRFVAEDKDKIYFPCEYDGLTWIGWVYKDINRYIRSKELLPYFGY
jgi:hypothetical protein